MKKCEYCGNKITDDVAVCPHCGAVVGESKKQKAEEPQITPPINNNIPAYPPYAYRKKNNKAAAIIAIIVAVVILAISVLFVILIEKSNDDFTRLSEQNTSEIAFSLFGDKLEGDEKSIKLNTPETPLTINKYGYSGNVEVTAQITDIEVKTEYGFTIINLTAEMTYNNSYSSSTYAEARYKILDSKGVIAYNGTIMIGDMSVGDKMRGKIYANNLKSGEEYTLVIEDYRY